MTQVKPKTKEQVIHFLLSNLSLGSYNKRFLENLETQYVTTNKALTTNQAALLDKVISQYERQLRKLEVSTTELINLPWSIQPVQSLSQYTEPQIFLVEDELIVRTPYKTSFVQQFKKLTIGAKWEHNDRFWRMPASTYTFKKVYDYVNRHFSVVNYDDSLTDMLQKVTDLSTTDNWHPSYVFKSGNFYINNTNEYLDIAASTLELDSSPATIARLVSYGVNIDSTVIEHGKTFYAEDSLLFAANREVSLDVSDSTVVDKVALLKPDLVVVVTGTGKWPRIKNIATKLQEQGVMVHESISMVNFKLPESVDNGFVVTIETGIPLIKNTDLTPTHKIVTLRFTNTEYKQNERM
jgi:hypothetical protein